MDATWQDFFKGFEFSLKSYAQAPDSGSGVLPDAFEKELKVLALIQGYRNRGHLFTKTNPVIYTGKPNQQNTGWNWNPGDGDQDLTWLIR